MRNGRSRRCIAREQRADQRRDRHVVMRRQRARPLRDRQLRRRDLDLDRANRPPLCRSAITTAGRHQPHFAGQRIAERRPSIVLPGFEPVVASRLIEDERMDIAFDRPARRAIDPVNDRGDPESSHFHYLSMARMGKCESLLYSPILWLNRANQYFA